MATGTELEKTARMTPAKAPLSGGLGTLWTRAKIFWAGLQPRQRAWAGVSGALLAGVIGFLAWYAVRPDWRVLYAGLDADDARQVAQTLLQAQIQYDVDATSGAIRVPAAQLDKARLATASKGGVKSGRMGFELFDKPNWVGSEFDEQVNYQRALEGELEHTVSSLADVETARVHLVMPHDSLFRDQDRPAKASVVLKLRHRTLSDGEPDAIRNLVASAVDGLTPDHVVLVDAAGRVSLGPRTADTERLKAEQALEDKLIATLEPVTGVGNVRASVTLDYVDTALDETQELYDPTQSATLSMQRTEQSAGPQPVAAGVPGTASNAPNTQAVPVYPQQNTPPQTAKTESGTYGVSKTVKHTTEDPGRVRRMTAAIVVNDRMTQPATSKRAAQWQPRSPDELRNLTALAQAAVGFDNARGDLLTVEDLSFQDNAAQTAPTLIGRTVSAAENSPVLVKYAMLLLALLLVLALGVRPALARISAPPAAKHGAKELPGAAARGALAAEGASEDESRSKAQNIFEQVQGQLKREPAQGSRLLQSWIHSE
ncbi:MAG: flagellar basal-body MS-ring/collar protein FliF [Acidobacteriota bacterium]